MERRDSRLRHARIRGLPTTGDEAGLAGFPEDEAGPETAEVALAGRVEHPGPAVVVTGDSWEEVDRGTGRLSSSPHMNHVKSLLAPL